MNPLIIMGAFLIGLGFMVKPKKPAEKIVEEKVLTGESQESKTADSAKSVPITPNLETVENE